VSVESPDFTTSNQSSGVGLTPGMRQGMLHWLRRLRKQTSTLAVGGEEWKSDVRMRPPLSRASTTTWYLGAKSVRLSGWQPTGEPEDHNVRTIWTPSLGAQSSTCLGICTQTDACRRMRTSTPTLTLPTSLTPCRCTAMRNASQKQLHVSLAALGRAALRPRCSSTGCCGTVCTCSVFGRQWQTWLTG
jgi:hypothetical protein